MSNYRPVSCLPAASKLLEKIVCEQLSEYFEKNGLLPKSQHGFRANRSTMTAWSEMQEEWSKNSEDKNMTGILLWDLSAAFDTLDPTIMCNKLKLYGLDENSVNWFNSYLTGRSQRTKIGQMISKSINLTSGVPQGGILSPLLYIIYVADFELWMKFSRIKSYADDSTSNFVLEHLM